jgi:hypothetical protein
VIEQAADDLVAFYFGPVQTCHDYLEFPTSAKNLIARFGDGTGGYLRK